MSRGTEYAKQILRAHSESNEKVADVGFPAAMLQEMVDEIGNLDAALDTVLHKQYEENKEKNKAAVPGEIRCGCGSTVWEYGIRQGLWYLRCGNGHNWTVSSTTDIWFRMDTANKD